MTVEYGALVLAAFTGPPYDAPAERSFATAGPRAGHANVTAPSP
jgi:hypothetical protein